MFEFQKPSRSKHKAIKGSSKRLAGGKHKLVTGKNKYSSKRESSKLGGKTTSKMEATNLTMKTRFQKPVQTKSLEQIFPEDDEECQDNSSRTQPLASSAQTSSKEVGSETNKREDFFLLEEPDIIDVEQEMVHFPTAMPEATLDTSKQVLQENTGKAGSALPFLDPYSFKEDMTTLITAPRPLKRSVFDAINNVDDVDLDITLPGESLAIIRY